MTLTGSGIAEPRVQYLEGTDPEDTYVRGTKRRENASFSEVVHVALVVKETEALSG